MAAAAALAATRGAAKEQQPVAAASDLPWFARLVNHVLTPGSALSSEVWAAFNVIMALLLGVWLMLVIAFYDNIHIWVFGVLFIGLALSTNWFMKEVMAVKAAEKKGAEDASSADKKKKGKKDK